MKALLLILMVVPVTIYASASSDALVLVPPYQEIRPSFWETYRTFIATGTCLGLFLIFTAWALLQPRTSRAASMLQAATNGLKNLVNQTEDAGTLSETARWMKCGIGLLLGFNGEVMTTAEFNSTLARHPRCDPQVAAAAGELLLACDRDRFKPGVESPPLLAASRALQIIRHIEQHQQQIPTPDMRPK